jgi:DNA-directed RNA polymerase subunit RPC12/RpoP
LEKQEQEEQEEQKEDPKNTCPREGQKRMVNPKTTTSKIES